MDDSNKQADEEEELSEEQILASIEALEEEIENLKKNKQVAADDLFARMVPKLDEYLSQAEKIVEGEFADLKELVDEEASERVEAVSEVVEALASLSSKVDMFMKIKDSIAALGTKMEASKTSMMAYADRLSATSKEIGYRALNLANELASRIPELQTQLDEAHDRIDKLPKPYDDKDIWKELEDLRALVLSHAASGGGGNMNRNISIGGNSSVLGRYTDLNIKAGNNVTLTYTNNDSTKYVDLTIAATGGAGTTRSVTSASTSRTAGAVASTDYVYICSAGIALTLPTAAANTNLYTIKNTSTSSVLVATTGGETIDTSSNLILATQFTSVDLISDGTNWEIT